MKTGKIVLYSLVAALLVTAAVYAGALRRAEAPQRLVLRGPRDRARVQHERVRRSAFFAHVPAGRFERAADARALRGVQPAAHDVQDGDHAKDRR